MYRKERISTHEVENTIIAYNLGVGPRIISYGKDYVELERYQYSYGTYIALYGFNAKITEKVVELLTHLHKHGYWHGDDSEDNVVLNIKNGEFDVKLIDFRTLLHLPSIDVETFNKLCAGHDNEFSSIEGMYEYELKPWKSLLKNTQMK